MSPDRPDDLSEEGTPFEEVEVADEELSEAEAILKEMLEIERAAAAFYATLLERVRATPELAEYEDEIEDMAIEEAEHAEMVEELLERRGIKVVVEE